MAIIVNTQDKAYFVMADNRGFVLYERTEGNWPDIDHPLVGDTLFSTPGKPMVLSQSDPSNLRKRKVILRTKAVTRIGTY